MSFFKIKQILKRIMIKFPTIYKVTYFTKSIITDYDGRYHMHSYGPDNDSIFFYLIRPRTNGIEGLMALFIWVLKHLDYADTNGLIPVIDMKNYITQYYDGEHNVWEWFFKQVSDYKLKDIYASKNVIISGYKIEDYLDSDIISNRVFYDASWNKYCNRLYKKYISTTESINKMVNREMISINPQQCIGVFLRGTDYVKLKPSGENVQPSCEMVFQKVTEFANKYSCNNVFLVTEDKMIFQWFNSKKSINVFTVSDDILISGYAGTDVLSKSGILIDDKYKLGSVYLTKIILLSKCRYLVSSIASGSKVAWIMNGNEYYDSYVFDLGLYD